MSTFEVYKDKKGETRFRYRAANGEIVFSSEGYKAKASALKSIESLKKGVADAVIEDLTKVTAAPKADTKATKAKAAPKAAASKATAAAKAPAKPKAAAKAKAPAKSKPKT